MYHETILGLPLPILIILLAVLFLAVFLPVEVLAVYMAYLVNVLLILTIANITKVRPSMDGDRPRVYGRFVKKWQAVMINLFYMCMLALLTSLVTNSIIGLIKSSTYINKILLTLAIFGAAFIYSYHNSW